VIACVRSSASFLGFGTTRSPFGVFGRGLPSWLTVNAIPAIVTVEERTLTESFGATVTLTEPGPVPFLGSTVTHAALLAEDQGHPDEQDRLTELVAPA
jgi:hypothetical protein